MATARSLDDLVDSILDQVALSSARGASLKDIVRYTRDFYAQPYNASLIASSTRPHSATTRIDKSFISQVWRWLTTHGDLHIGRNNEYRDFSLEQIEASFPDVLSDVSNSSDQFDLSATSLKLASGGGPKSTKSKDPGPRIYANQDRIYHAVCGHEPDPSRVSELEFSLLCTIAAARHDGILQGELGRVTKQDKRSVPKRTDALQIKGYVEKQAAYHTGHKTSRIFLRRFAGTLTTSDTADHSLRLSDLARQVLTVLKEKQLATQDDVASHLSILDPAKYQVLTQIVQYLLRKGCLRRAEPAFAPDSAAGGLKITLQYVRALEAADHVSTDDDTFDLNTSLDTAVVLARGITEAAEEDGGAEPGLESVSPEIQTSQTLTRPRWNPDRALPNAIYDLASLGGDRGVTNMAFRQQVIGVNVRRPAESLLVRLSHEALKSQPSVGRDLALVRTTEAENGVHRFVHRTLETYHNMVLRGDLTWSATSGGSDYAKRFDTNLASSPLGISNVDTFGFTERAKSSQLMNSAGTTIEDIANFPGPDAAVIVRPGEATMVTDQTGSIVLSTMPEQVNSQSSSRSSSPQRSSCIVTLKLKPVMSTQQSTTVMKDTTTPIKSKTKPRTFLRGTHQFWMHIFRMRKLEVDPGAAKIKQAVLINDTDCLQMFAERPKDFDSLLVEVLKQDLPVPYSPAGVNETWVNKTKTFLDRGRAGLFYMPPGILNLQQAKWSCPVIIKSKRLSEFNVGEKHPHALVLFHSSSAAHTFRLHRIPQLKINGEEHLRMSDNPVARVDVFTHQPFTLAPIVGEASSEPVHDRTASIGNISRNTLSMVLSSPESKLQSSLSSTAREVVYDSSVPPKKRATQPGRSQRQRRPTKKALESAQTTISDESSPATPSSVTESLHKVYTGVGNVRKSPLLLPQTDVLFTNGTQLDHEMNSAHSTTALQENTTESPSSAFLVRKPQRSGSLDSSKIHDISIGHMGGIDQIQKRTLHAGDSEVLSTSREQADSRRISRVSIEAEAEARISAHSDEPAQCTNDDPGRSDGPEAKSSVPAAEGLGLVPAPSQNTSPTIDPAQLTLLTGKDAVPYYRNFVMELVYMCGGVVPHDASLLKRAMGPKSVEAHAEANMNIKIIKTSIGALTQSGRLKVMQFAFQKSGFNHTKAILALPSIQPNDPLLISMQTRISSLPADVDYVPPELEIEATRKPQGILRTADPPAPEPKAKPKPKGVVSARPKRQKKHSGSGSRGGSADLSQELTPTPEPVEVSSNTGFLTLRVPKIAQIKTDQLFTSKYFDLPAQPIVVDTNTRGGSPGAAFPAPSSARRNNARNSRRFTTATRKVQWRTPKCTPLPKSLRAILAYDNRSNQIDHVLNINPALETFDRDVDFVAAWEQKNLNDLQEPKPQEWNFINHLSFRKEFVDVRGEGDLQFRLTKINERDEEVETDFPEAESWEVFADILEKEAAKARKATENKAKRKRTVQDELPDRRSDSEEDDHSDFMSSDEERPKKKRQRGPNHKWRRKPRVAGTELDRRRQKRNYVNPRGIGLRDIPKALAHRVTTAIVVVRVLTGGLDKYLNWKLVARLIPGEPESMLQSRWRTLSTRYNNDFDAMVQDLQTKYLDALADDEVPSVNYNDLPGTDWEGIFEWAVLNINAEDKGTTVIELPPNREDFLELHTAEVGEATSVRPLHNNSLQYTQATKEDFWCSMISGTTPSSLPKAKPKVIEPVFPTEEDEADVQLARARSWVFAAVMTPYQSFDPKLTHEKLRKLADNEKNCEYLIDTAIKRLQNDKMVVTKDSADAVIQTTGTTLSGTYHWKLSTKFVDRFELNRHITSGMLKVAVKYKIEVLDTTFAKGEVVTIPGDPYLEDGVMVAIFNLMNAGMMQLEPGSDMTATRYGLDGGSEGYKTRSMDKKHLFFSVILRPTSSYIHGDLSSSEKHKVGIPRGDLDQADDLGLIPMWFDINHDFRPDIWDMVVGAITGLISCRPGVSTLELVRTLGYAIVQRDMEMIVGYLFDCKLIEKTRSGWETTEIWWFAIGTGTETRTENGVHGG